MKTIRKGVFETNSSSTHSVTIMSKEDYNKWRNNEILYNFDNDEITNLEERRLEVRKDLSEYLNPDNISEEAIDDYLYDNRSCYAQTYDEYCDNDNLEIDVNEHTSKSGDEIVIICKYGRDY